MIFPRFSRRIVVGLLGVLLLLCQTAAVAHACILSTSSPADSGMVQPCHESNSGTDTSNPEDLCQTYRSSLHAIPAAAKFVMLPAMDLPALPASLGQTFPAAYPAATKAPRLQLARANSPPLPIVHCRLLN